jgi:hypothetical protein
VRLLLPCKLSKNMDTQRHLIWPELKYEEWSDTIATLHMWSQMVGKVRLKLTPLVNHWWNVPLYISARGLTTSAIPYEGRAFEMYFDFIAHKLTLETSDGLTKTIKLEPISVADFYRQFEGMLKSAGIDVRIWKMPVEIPNAIAFDADRMHASYDPEYANRFWRVLVASSKVLHEFRAGFVGKCSPVHFFWGSFDLALSRFSGRRAPRREGADRMTAEGYSHELSSVGFWPGNDKMPASFYSYAAPSPQGFGDSRVRPEAAYFHKELGEFLLPYENVRQSDSPEMALLEFCHSTYEAAATLGNWDREALER